MDRGDLHGNAPGRTGKTGISDVDKMLTYFYMLNDESRKEVVDFLMFKLNSGKDPEREEQIKQFKKWK